MNRLERVGDEWVLTGDLFNPKSIKPFLDLLDGDLKAFMQHKEEIEEKEEAALLVDKVIDEVRRKTMTNVEITTQETTTQKQETVKPLEHINMDSIAVYPYKFSNGQKVFVVIAFQDDKLFPEDGDLYFFTPESIFCGKIDIELWFRSKGKNLAEEDINTLYSMLMKAKKYPYLQFTTKKSIEQEEIDEVNTKVDLIKDIFDRLDQISSH